MYSLNEYGLAKEIEKWTEEDFQRIEQALQYASAKTGIPIYRRFIVGSVVFHHLINDIDIAVEFKAEYSKSKKMEFKKAVKKVAGSKIDIHFVLEWKESLRVCDLGFMVPYFDLQTRELKHKIPGVKIPFHFSYKMVNGDINRLFYTTFDKTKSFEILSTLQRELRNSFS